MEELKNRTKAPSGVYTGALLENGTVAYRGVRFATAERWQRPVVVGPSDREIDAREFGPASDKGAPDCLNLTLYANPESTRTDKAVFMWQYGSAQMGGDNRKIQFHNFVKEHPDIIVVCPNHRGHFFGSISLRMLEGYEEKKALYEASNNLTRLDLLACMKWIRENIAAFGGDPEKVTIGGHSSGSNNCTFLFFMEEARPYFKRAACQASFCCDTSLQPLETADIVSKMLFDSLNVHTLEEALQIPIDVINEEKDKIMGKAFRMEPPFDRIEYKLFSPVIDLVCISDDYYEKLLAGNFMGKELMIGHNSGEYDMGYERFRPLPDGAEQALRYSIDQNFGKLSDRGWNKENGPKIVEEYLSHNEEYGRDLFTAAMDLKNDLMLRLDALVHTAAISRYADVYTYINDIGIDKLKGRRISHGSENNLIAGNLEEVPEDMKEQVKLLGEIWAAFIETGDPNCASLPCTWEKFNRQTNRTIFLGDDTHMMDGFRPKDTELLFPLLRETKYL